MLNCEGNSSPEENLINAKARVKVGYTRKDACKENSISKF